MVIFFKVFNKIKQVIFIKNIFRICFVIIGTIIGAGFASGKEIYSFFCIYGIYGFLGLLISNIIIGEVIYLTFIFISRNNIKTYSEIIRLLIGNNNILNYTVNNIMNVFLLVSYIVMVSGFGAYFSQEFNLPKIGGSIIISIFSFFVFFKNINGIIKINTYLIPFLIILISFLGVRCNILSFDYNTLVNSHDIQWLLKSFLYASYNSIILIPIIINLNNLISNKKQIKLVSLFTVFFMIIMSVIIYTVLSMNMPKINTLDIPIVYIASKFRLNF